ncbi:MAG TPA: hypothetical protein VMW35_18485 [Myxococcota bacterium]|jgi:hypothetical protein|nr:hypothetical protein [Myxococcota bacterium]
MTLSGWSALAQIVCAVAVVVAVVYLAGQLRRTIRALRSAVYESGVSPHAAYLGILAQDNDLARVIRTGTADYHTLRSEDQLQFWALGHMVLNAFEKEQLLHREGALSAGHQERSVKVLRWWFSHPGFVQFWDAEKHLVSDDFVRFVETSVLDREAQV